MDNNPDFKIPTDILEMVDMQDLIIKYNLAKMLNDQMSKYYKVFLDAHSYTLQELLQLVPEQNWDSYNFMSLCKLAAPTDKGYVYHKRKRDESEHDQLVKNQQRLIAGITSIPASMCRDEDEFVDPNDNVPTNMLSFTNTIDDKILSTLNNVDDMLKYHYKDVNLVNNVKYVIDHVERKIYNATPYYTFGGYGRVSSTDIDFCIENDVLICTWSTASYPGTWRSNEDPTYNEVTYNLYFNLRKNTCISEKEYMRIKKMILT